MSDRTNAPEKPRRREHQECGPRETIEALGELLTRKDSTADEIYVQAEILQSSIEDYLKRLAEDGVFEEAVFNTPWLTHLSESLRQQQKTLVVAARELCDLSRAAEGSDRSRREIERKFEELAELVVEHESGVGSLVGSPEDWAEL
jgi:hypothetical protein